MIRQIDHVTVPDMPDRIIAATAFYDGSSPSYPIFRGYR